MNIVDVNAWNNILDKMVIIGGSARSGTTIMGKLINSLEKTEYLFEPPMLESLLLKKDELTNKSLKELIQFYFFDNFLLDALAGRNINLNTNDDSCILHVKDSKEIEHRYKKSLSRTELEEQVKKTTFGFKLPEIVFFLDTMNELFPQSRTVLMHRNPNDVIDSIVRKKWFSDEYLNVKHPSQVLAIDVIDEVKIPYWVKSKDKNFWIGASELDRCAYYYIRISEEISKNGENSIIINYDNFIKNPKKIFETTVEILGLKYGLKTATLLDTVHCQNKNEINWLEKLDAHLLSSLKYFTKEIRKSAL